MISTMKTEYMSAVPEQIQLRRANCGINLAGHCPEARSLINFSAIAAVPGISQLLQGPGSGVRNCNRPFGSSAPSD